ncbi:MAG: PhzF family phenazine biosynthesis protein [Parvularcula sp.]|jgi:PhzF family phenazine biosynthesis protein|nr:PhzF family phenazine biosynthesis protein [Parvularcula sp.]
MTTAHEFLVIDAFTDRPFAGNPAAVMRLDDFLPDDRLQAIAKEHNLSETAFLVPAGEGRYRLRWFTPGGEVPLCGHATMASGYALLEEWGERGEKVVFETLSGELQVSREDGRFRLDLPAAEAEETEADDALRRASGEGAVRFWRAGTFAIAELASEEAVAAFKPDLAAIEALDADELGITALGQDGAVVSRLFAPKLGIAEDPFTGSLQAVLVPLWAKRLGKTELAVRQISARGGEASSVFTGERVFLFGNAVTTMRGQIFF